MGEINARVDDRHDGVSRPRRYVPCLRSVDVGIEHAAGLADVIETVELAEVRIVGEDGVCCDFLIRLEVGESPVARQIVLQAARRAGSLHEHQTGESKSGQDLQAVTGWVDQPRRV